MSNHSSARRGALARLACVPLMSLAAGSAVAQAYPSRPIRLVVPWPAGGANDILGRVLASSLMKTVGQSVVVDNRGGANGMMGADVVAKAAPDGYTLMFHSITSQVTNPAFYKKLPYDSINDFVPITQVAAIPLVIVAHPSFPAHSVDELIKLARSQPGKINYASFGNASISHLAGELFNKMGDVNLTHVPYKGAAPALNDTLSGQVPLYFASVAPTIPLIQAGKLRAVAVTGAHRSKQLPEVPTVAESPQFRGYEAVGMFAVWAPKGTPADIVAMLNRSLRTSMASAEFKESLDKLGAIGPLGNSPEDMAKTIRSDMEKLTNLVKSSGIQAD